MTQVVLNINDNKVEFFMELVKNFDFVKVEDYTEPTNKKIKASIRQGLEEVKLIEQGKKKGTPLNDFLNEL
jgi:tetrahydromethanopterin S-methyltransferase subunit A